MSSANDNADPARAEILATLDALRKQVKRGEVECVAIVAVTATSIVQPVYVGAAQTPATILATALALTAHAHEIVADACSDDGDEDMPDAGFSGPGDERAN